MRYVSLLILLHSPEPDITALYYAQTASWIICKLLPYLKWPTNKHLIWKTKCTLVQALRLCTGRTAHRESRGIALLFHDHGPRRGWGVSVTPWSLFTPGKDPVPIVQGAGWAPGPVWTSAENLAPTVIRSPDSPACSQSLYRLSYPAQRHLMYCVLFQWHVGRA